MPIVEERGVLKLNYGGEVIATALYFTDENDEAGVATAINGDYSQGVVAGLLLASAVALLEPAHRVKVIAIIKALEASYENTSEDDIPF